MKNNELPKYKKFWQNYVKPTLEILTPLGGLYIKRVKGTNSKLAINSLLSILYVNGAVAYASIVLASQNFNPFTQKESLKEIYKQKTLEKEEFQKKVSSVENYVNDSNPEISFSEEYEIRKLMEVQDSSKIYYPTKEDWEKAYKKINSKMLNKQRNIN